MSTYVLHVHTGHENDVRRELILSLIPSKVPSECVTERRCGKKHRTEHVLFPGYVFVTCALTDSLYHMITRIPHVLRFLGTPAEPLTIAEVEYIHWLDGCAGGLELSCPVGGRAVIRSGPFKGKQGVIVRINRRRKRVRLRLEICGTPFEVSIGYTEVTTI